MTLKMALKMTLEMTPTWRPVGGRLEAGWDRFGWRPLGSRLKVVYSVFKIPYVLCTPLHPELYHPNPTAKKPKKKGVSC